MNIFPRLTRLSARQLLGLSLLYNLPYALFHIQRGAFDTYIHIFLADHYRRAWFDLWEPRWYLGFSVASYPPLVHQLIALLSWPVTALSRWFNPPSNSEPYPGAWRWLSEESAYVMVMLAVLVLFPLAVRAFARCFVGPRAATVAGLLTVILPGLSLALWSFGQLPSVAATAVVLLAMARGHAFLQSGRARHLVQAVALAGAAAATHHGVFLLVPFVAAAVVIQAWLTRHRVTVSPFHLVTVQKPLIFLFRLAAWTTLSALLVAAVLWPLLQWSRGQSLQVPIDHLSRHNLLRDFKAALFFFWPVYGPLLLMLPWVGWAALRMRRRMLAPGLLALLLLVLGLGGTTPLPRWLYRAGWEWLTYERFAFWAAVVLVPLAAAALLLVARRRPQVAGAFLGAMFIASLLGGLMATISRSQPPVVDLAPIARFLAQPEQQPYRYFTLGFGDQLARLSALTSNGTPDGTYHTARGLPELRASGLGSIDTVMWTHQARRAGPFLEQAQRYGARWAFVHHAHYPAVLRAAGWNYRFMIGTVQVWEQPDVTPVRVAAPPGLNRSPAAFWWGLAPLAIFALSALALAVDLPWGAWRASWTRPGVVRALRTLRLGAWALTIVLLTLWWYHGFYHGDTAWVYFVYQTGMLFVCDLAAAATLVLWVAERALHHERLSFGPRGLLWGGVGLMTACALSLQDSVDVRLTQALLINLLLLGGWYFMLVNDPPSPRLASTAFVLVFGTQALVALAQAATQTTVWLDPLGLPWPGGQDPHSPGVSVVQTASGGRWLRAYGTLGHPNILGGFLVVGLGAAMERYRATRRRGWLGAAWLIAAGLLLSFSRSAWLAALVAVGVFAWLLGRWGQPNWAKVRRWAAAGFGALTLLSLPLLPLLLARANVGEDGTRLEQRSMDDRRRLNQAAYEMLLDRPLSGVGGGAFVVRLYQVAGVNLPLEPAHNLLLLLAAEMGWPGVGALAALLAALAWRLWRRRQAGGRGSFAAAELVSGAVLVGLLAIGVFDHYWWTTQPARLALATALGLWVGWGEAAIRWESRAPADSARPATQTAARLPG